MTGGGKERYGASAEWGHWPNIWPQKIEANKILHAEYQNYELFFTKLSAKNVVHKSKVVINFKIIERADFFP
jgi:hypothetical protein